jgi:hypothetical protein
MALLARCWTLLIFLVLLFLLLFFIINNYSTDACSALKLSSLAHFLISCHVRPCLFIHSIHIAATALRMYSRPCNRQFITYVSKSLLDAFTTSYRASFSFAISVCLCLSVRMQHLGSHSKDFYWIWYMRIFRKSVEKIQDGRTDTTKLIVAFGNFANVPKDCQGKLRNKLLIIILFIKYNCFARN